jgi:hypothetical protein
LNSVAPGAIPIDYGVMRPSFRLGVGFPLVLSFGCAPGVTGDVFSSGGSGGTTVAATAASTAASNDQSSAAQFMSGTGTSGGMTCVSGPDEDKDMDGFTVNQGDCNDCDPNVNPGAIEVIDTTPDPMTGMVPPPADEDCDGMVDNVAPPCDANLAVDEQDPMVAAKAVELCKQASPSGNDWGTISAKWVLPDGSSPGASPNFDLGHGVLSAFGPNVQVKAGARMLAVSSGAARQPNDPGYQSVGGFSKGYTCNHPQGFPKESPACPNVTTGQPHDGAGLEVSLRAPTNATGFSFQFNFYTYEWPGYICSQFNDFFVAILSPTPQGQTDGNISFDVQGNPVSVNNAFLEACGCFNGPPCTAGGKNFTCSLGDSSLMGNGFGSDLAGSDHGSTYWLETTAPVTPGQVISLRWAAYDSGDGVLDSTALVDNFQWIANGGTVTVGTTPVPQ